MVPPTRALCFSTSGTGSDSMRSVNALVLSRLPQLSQERFQPRCPGDGHMSLTQKICGKGFVGSSEFRIRIDKTTGLDGLLQCAVIVGQLCADLAPDAFLDFLPGHLTL